ncbi:N-acetylmuramoyl-L-alanine amidase [Neobacillus ginsengisoli]|uniref:N-acetylmuramoyl-L-alanine amidase n=1 Tax=Neobacillus ginsengisoli TaxID=904295 RepID=A0ABT9Y230_9BACI|nr:N-acetylmuramoyl-L-alanine amidase [Neobacillus ginsengisoli]MDQ0201872.1 N-acetylmuramoyl-L-alanine amidase [Neobacillus ginsengisoli]
MKNLRLIKVLTILSVIVLPFLVGLSQKYQIKLSSTQAGWVLNVNIKQARVKFKTKTHKRVTPTENLEATVGVNGLNVREQPSLSSSVVGKLNLGTKVTVNDEQSGWAKVKSSSGIQGWVYTNYISKDEASNNNTQPVTGPTISTDSIQNTQEPLKGKTIVLDPGHGGSDDGTTSIVGTYEKTLTIATAKIVDQKLENAGAKVIMTRTNDTYVPLQQRADVSNKNHADAFISFHYNWINDPLINGLTDFYYQKSKDYLLASDILNEVVKTTGLNNDGTRFDDLDVLRNNSQPCTLIELGFLSNKQDDSVVESSTYHDNVAQGVYLGLLDYFSTKKQETKSKDTNH